MFRFKAGLIAAVLLGTPALAAPGEPAAREMRHIEASFPGRMAGTPQEDKAARYVGGRLAPTGRVDQRANESVRILAEVMNEFAVRP